MSVLDSYKKELDPYDGFSKHYDSLRVMRQRSDTMKWSTLVLCSIAAFLGLLVLTGCGTPGYVRADAIDGTLFRTLDRHDAYVREDESLSDLQKRTDLRDSELLRRVVTEAKQPQGGEPSGD